VLTRFFYRSGVIAEKPDELLFAMDFGGDDKIERREAKALKPLKMDEILSSRSAVPAVDSRKRKGAVTTDGVIESKKLRRPDGVSFAQLQRLRRVAASGQGSAASILASAKKGVPDFDPWAEDAEDRFKKRAEKELEKLDFVDRVVKPQAPATLKMRPVSQAVIGKVPAVRMPEPGISYNPEFEKWDQLLREEGEKEVELEKKRLAEEAEEARIQALIEAPEEEMESESESESSEEEEADEEEEENVDEKPEVKRKTQAQRNREARQKELARKREEEKKLKLQERELMLVKKYTREIKYQEKLRAARLAAKGQVDDDEMNPKIMRKKQFGKIPYVVPTKMVAKDGY
jgi:nucleolar protein 53